MVVDDYGWIVNGDPERGPTPRGSSVESSSRRRSTRSRASTMTKATTTATASGMASTVYVTRITEKQHRLDAKRTKKWEKMLNDWYQPSSFAVRVSCRVVRVSRVALDEVAC